MRKKPAANAVYTYTKAGLSFIQRTGVIFDMLSVQYRDDVRPGYAGTLPVFNQMSWCPEEISRASKMNVSGFILL